MKCNAILLVLFVLTSCDFSPEVIVQKEVVLESTEFNNSFFFGDEDFMNKVAEELEAVGIRFTENEDGSVSYRSEDRSIVQTIGDRLVSERFKR